MRTKTVAIIGAGPAGLIAAKTFLHNAPPSAFSVTIFERSRSLGGIWALRKDAHNEHDFLAASTPTNLSRYTVGFSDLAWSPQDTRDDQDGASTEEPRPKHQRQPEQRDGKHVSMFPTARMAGRYLERFATVNDLRSHIRFGCRVVNIKRSEVEPGRFEWHVSHRNSGSSSPEKALDVFDHVIVASGFFSQPRELEVPIESAEAAAIDPSPVRVIHSSLYRHLSSILPQDQNIAGKSILIVGGGNSAGEAAGTVAYHLSSALHSAPGATKVKAKGVQDVRVHHVTPAPLYGVPPFVAHADDDASGFVPIDLRLYDLARRPPGPIISSYGRVPEPVIEMIHGAVQDMIGGNQSDLGYDALTVDEEHQKATAKVALSETYPEYVRSGSIIPHAGRLVRLVKTSSDGETLAAVVAHQGKEVRIENIAAVIYATGYRPHVALSYLDPSLREKLEYDGTSTRLPLILDERQTVNKSLPDLAFLGFYEGPYWGVMEMQARILARRWSPDAAQAQLDITGEEPAKLRDLREAMRTRKSDVPQYWIGDYLGFLEVGARELGLIRNDAPFTDRNGPVSPARYLSPQCNSAQPREIMNDLHNTYTLAGKGRYVARAAFRALHGKWRLHRRLDSFRDGFPSGSFDGVTHFHPREVKMSISAQKESRVERHDFEHLYTESGAFVADLGMSMTASRRYAYRYCEEDDRLSVWFVTEDTQVDYLFHDIEFTGCTALTGGETSKNTKGKRRLYTAKAAHLCIDDMYETSYEFEMLGVRLLRWRVKHSVKGPAKNYVSDSWYER